jgi:hypothetical protein
MCASFHTSSLWSRLNSVKSLSEAARRQFAGIFLLANPLCSPPHFRARLSDAKSSRLVRGMHTAARSAVQPRDWSDINGSGREIAGTVRLP